MPETFSFDEYPHFYYTKEDEEVTEDQQEIEVIEEDVETEDTEDTTS